AQAVQAASTQGIRSLSVESVAGRPGELLVSADLDRAPLKLLVERLFEQARVSHLIQTQSLMGRVTARFERHPLPSMLVEILGPHGYVAEVRDGLIVISDAPQASGAATMSPAPGAPSPPPGPE